MNNNIKDFSSVIVLDGKTHGIASMVYQNKDGVEYVVFYTTALYYNCGLTQERFDLSKEDASKLMRDYGNKICYIGVNNGKLDEFLSTVEI